MKVHFTTLGCPKNQVDSELMQGMLTQAGHELTDAAGSAECLIVNTCAFIDRAREESVNTILELARVKETGRARALIVTGCLTQRYGGEILTEIPEVNAILGTSELHRIVELVNQAEGRQDWVTNAPPGYLYDARTPRLLSGRVPYAYVKIAEGCDMGCTFCAIPQFRGAHRSRPLQDVVAEVEGLARQGIQEAILVSQDTLAYGREIPGNGDIGDLLLALSDTRMPWIRPMYLHPAHVNDRLVDKWRRARVVPYLDMPVQHGDDEVLRAMRRAVTARRMKDVVAQFRAAIPGLAIRTTVLVGFPGETDAAFDNLLGFVEDVGFDRLGRPRRACRGRSLPRSWRSALSRCRSFRTGWPGRDRRPSSGRGRRSSWMARAPIPPSPSRGARPGRPRRSTASSICVILTSAPDALLMSASSRWTATSSSENRR